MADFTIPTRKQINDRSKTDVQAELQESNPFLKNSVLKAMIAANSGRNYEFYLQAQNLLDAIFVQTSTDTFLEMWGALRGVTLNPATQSKGFITITGVAGNSVLPGETLASTSGQTYEVQTLATIVDQTLVVNSITRLGTVATVTTASEHKLGTGVSVTISGADQTEYNITASITVIGLDTFTYTVSGAPITPATGTLLADATFASTNIDSVSFGSDTNLTNGATLTFTTPIAGVDNNTTVQFEGLSGGADVEDPVAYRARVIEAFQNPSTPFNVANIERVAKTVTGVTRVFVQEITPDLGQVTIYFVRDNDDNIIPTASEVQDVKDQILTIKPAHTADVDVIVAAPTPRVIDFQFVQLTPNTPTMQQAITNTLIAVFEDELILGENVLAESYNCAIFQTVDPETGASVQSFTLISPTGDILLSDNEIPVLGQVVFP